MIQVYEPTNYFQKKEGLSLFLAGGIDRAPDWQKEAIAYVMDKYSQLDLAILNPRRNTPFSKDDYQSHKEQVQWEFDHLRLADAIIFWFPDNAPCTTSLFELGYWLNTFKVSLGINPGHYKEKSIKTQVSLLNKSRGSELHLEVKSSLEKTLDEAINFLSKRDLQI